MKIVFTGSPGTPYSKSAGDVRLASFAELLLLIGYEVEIINRYCSTKIADNEEFDRFNIKELVDKKRGNRLLDLILYLASVLYEPIYLIRSNRNSKIDFIHIYSGHFVDFLLYWFYSKLIGAKTIYQYVEYRSSIQRQGLYHKLNGYLCDHYGPILWDGAITISHFLNKESKKRNPGLRTTIIPPICKLSHFDQVVVERKRQIIYCGSLGYQEIIDSILEAYCASEINNDFSLVMVLSGPANKIAEYKERYCSEWNICFYSNIPYIDLIHLYKASVVGVIPMRNTIQDIARFPNKICEYCAASVAIITSNYGEIPYHFVHEKNAMIMEDHSVSSLIDCFDWVAHHTEKISSISDYSYQTGKAIFNIESYRDELSVFLDGMKK